MSGNDVRRIGPPALLLRGMDVLWFLAPFLVVVALWAVVVRALHVPLRVFPSVGDVLRAGLQEIQRGTLFDHIEQSLARVLVGTILAIVTSIPIGIAMSTNRFVAALLAPILRFFAVLAGIAWIPIATLWFGYGFGAITFVIFNAVFFVVAYNTMLGVASIPQAVRNAAASLGATPRQILIEVLLPGALPNIVTGIRTGMGYAWRGLIAAEMIATNAGLGYMLFMARDFYRTEVIILGMILIGAIWLAMDRLILAPVERRTIERWGLARRMGS
ncbi:MAG: ABC transporter permease [Candidatus Methylomirabilota bacterium]